MKSIKMLGATSRQSCSTPTPSFPFALPPSTPPTPRSPLPAALRVLQPPPNSHSFAVRNRENPYVRSRYLPPAPAPQVSQPPVYHRRAMVWVGCKVRARRCVCMCRVYARAHVCVCVCARVKRTRMRDYRAYTARALLTHAEMCAHVCVCV